jgi:hypothetical protein
MSRPSTPFYRRGVLDHPVKPGDDSEVDARLACTRNGSEAAGSACNIKAVIARRDRATQYSRALAFNFLRKRSQDVDAPGTSSAKTRFALLPGHHE